MAKFSFGGMDFYSINRKEPATPIKIVAGREFIDAYMENGGITEMKDIPDDIMTVIDADNEAGYAIVPENKTKLVEM